jgi:hypothetical protein
MIVKINKLILLLFLIPISGFGQIRIGPKAGLNIATQYKSDYTVPKYGFMFGGAIDIPITSGFSVQGEFLVTKKGYREEFKGDEIFDELTSTYFEIPAMAKYTITKVNFAYFFQGGVYWSIWSAGSYKSSIDGNNIIVEDYVFQSEYDQDGYKDNRSDFGLVAEAGVTYDNLGSGVLVLGLRYSHSLIPTNNYQNPPPDTVNKLNKVITISLGYFLYL